jgi:hypothetical protein
MLNLICCPCNHNEELQRLLGGMAIDHELDGETRFEPTAQHQLEERT